MLVSFGLIFPVRFHKDNLEKALQLGPEAAETVFVRVKVLIVVVCQEI